MRPAILTFCALLAALGGCKACGDTVRPEAPTAVEAFGEEGGVSSDPLVVDLRSHERGAIELAMREHVVVVGYDAKGKLRFMTDCRIDGGYRYAGMQSKVEIVRLTDKSEVKNNLPLTGGELGVKLEAELARGTSIDIGFKMVGRQRTTVATANGEDLKGECKGATHYVRGAWLGAFAMDTGAAAKARGGLEVFGAGIEGAMASEKFQRKTDGDLEACKSASDRDERWPDQCGAIIRLELSPIAKADAAAADPAKQMASETADRCPKGMVRAAGKCARPKAGVAHLCKWGDAADCEKQCNLGNGDSCGRLGAMAYFGHKIPKDVNRAAALHEKGCSLGNPLSCTDFGRMLRYGADGFRRDRRRALKVFQTACSRGEPLACTDLGMMYREGDGVGRDGLRAAELLQRACNGGDRTGCTELGNMYNMGADIKRDYRRAAELYAYGCQGKTYYACTNLAYLYEFGLGVPKDVKRAVNLSAYACKYDNTNCTILASMYEAGIGVPLDERTAVGLYQRGCKAGDEFACAMLHLFYGGPPVNADSMRHLILFWRNACGEDIQRDCTNLGVVRLAAGKRDGKADLKRGCDLGDPWGCVLYGKRTKRSCPAGQRFDGRGCQAVSAARTPAAAPPPPKPSSTGSTYEKARQALFAGDRRKAAMLAAKAAKERDVRALKLIGLIYELEQNKAKAIEAYELYLKLSPTSRDAEMVRRKLRVLRAK